MEYLDLVVIVLVYSIVIGLGVAVIGAIIMTIMEEIKIRKMNREDRIITKEEYKDKKGTIDNLKDPD